jgi:hypothetical protein
MQIVIAMNKRLIILTICLLLLVSFATTESQPAGISQFIEDRNGQVSVWGVDIQLRRLSFNRKIMPNQIRIIDHKYNRDLKDMMTWSVSKDGKILQIRFKPGMGDFGTGNTVTVYLDSSAFIGQPDSYEWTIPTDVQ